MKRFTLSAFLFFGLLPMNCDPPQSDVGYVGGSITQLAVNGYHTLDGDRMWPPLIKYGGATVDEWANPDSDYWNVFDSAQSNDSAEMVWFELTMKDSDLSNIGGTEDDLYRSSVRAIKLIQQHAPDASVQVSAMADYDAGLCNRVSQSTVSMIQQVVDRLVKTEHVSAGPFMPRLTKSMVTSDTCHQNELGQSMHGLVLLDFYD